MCYRKGELVVCTAGREKGRLMCITECDGSFVYLADGRERTLEKPKRKNPLHIERTGKTLAESSMNTNKALRKALVREV